MKRHSGIFHPASSSAYPDSMPPPSRPASGVHSSANGQQGHLVCWHCLQQCSLGSSSTHDLNTPLEGVEGGLHFCLLCHVCGIFLLANASGLVLCLLIVVDFQRVLGNLGGA